VKFKVGEILWAKTPITLYLSTLSPTKLKDYMILNYFIPSSDSYICKAILKFRKKIVTFSSFFSKNC